MATTPYQQSVKDTAKAIQDAAREKTKQTGITSLTQEEKQQVLSNIGKQPTVKLTTYEPQIISINVKDSGVGPSKTTISNVPYSSSRFSHGGSGGYSSVSQAPEQVNINTPEQVNINTPEQTQPITPTTSTQTTQAPISGNLPYIPTRDVGSYIQQVQTQQFYRNPDTGEKIPIVRYEKIEPGQGGEATVGGAKFYLPKKSTASIEEIKQLQEEQPGQPKSNIREFYGTVSKPVKEFSYKTITTGFEELGLSDNNIRTISEFTSYASPIALVDPLREFMASASAGAAIKIKNQPLTEGAIFAVSYGLGLAAEGLPIAAKYAGELIGPRTGAILGTTTKVGTGLIAAGLTADYGITAAQTILSKDLTSTQRGELFGETALDFGVTALGVSKGMSGAKVIEGYARTIGRTELPITQGEYPQAPLNKQVEMFKTNIIPELSEKPLAFHTTSDVFYGSGKIEPLAGTSEFPGLYASTYVSTPFTRIGKSGSSDFSIKDIKQLVSDLTTVRKPGVAALQPDAFRYSPFKKVTPYKIGEQTFKFAFTKKSIPGVMDIPLLKTEIESIARPGTGSYKEALTATGNKYYININGKRVPIDLFKFEGEGEAVVLKESKKFEPSSYDITPSRSVKPLSSTYGGYSYSPTDSYVSKVISSLSGKSGSIISSGKSSSRSYGGSSGGSSSSGSSSSVSSIISSVSSIADNPSSGGSSGRSYGGSGSGSSSSTGTPPPYITPFYSGRLSPGKRRRAIQQRQAYNVFLKRRGKYTQVAGGIPRGRALFYGSDITRKELARTFKILPAGYTEEPDIDFMPSGNIYRQYKVKKGKRLDLGDTFIQKTMANLQSKEEKMLIQSAKRRKGKL